MRYVFFVILFFILFGLFLPKTQAEEQVEYQDDFTQIEEASAEADVTLPKEGIDNQNTTLVQTTSYPLVFAIEQQTRVKYPDAEQRISDVVSHLNQRLVSANIPRSFSIQNFLINQNISRHRLWYFYFEKFENGWSNIG